MSFSGRPSPLLLHPNEEEEREFSPLGQFANISDLNIVDGKCNQLQRDLKNLQDEFYKTFLDNHRLHPPPPAPPPSPASTTTTTAALSWNPDGVRISVGYTHIEINNYRPDLLGYVIGKRHRHIHQLYHQNKVRIVIPKLQDQPHRPIIIIPVDHDDIHLSSFLFAVVFVITNLSRKY